MSTPKSSSVRVPSKQMAGLKLSDSSASSHASSSPSHHATAASAASHVSSSTHAPVSASVAPPGGLNQARRRLSVMSGDPTKARETLDGAGTVVEEKKEVKTRAAAPAKKRSFTRWSALSKIGFVPFNPNKVNQDRYCEVTPFAGSEDRAVFGVFDGHGALGHEVSSFVSTELPAFLLKQKNLDTEPAVALTKAFLDCNAKLAKDSIDCSFSGTTGIMIYINGKTLYSCNAGDSRAVLGKRTATPGQIKAVPLSSDHKPDRPDERKRIHDCKGRVEACKGLKGEDIGPARVWLLHQDVPGLAMTRSFGDLVAATVGVIAKPEIWDRTLDDNDAFIILASDGVWEFIDSQEACDLIARAPDPAAACQLLVDESVKRWHQEEEVVDDISCVVIYL